MNLRISTFLTVLLLMIGSVIHAQEDVGRRSNLELQLKAGVLLSGKVQFYEGIFDPGPSFVTGLSLGYDINRFHSVQFEYMWATHSDATFSSYQIFDNDFEATLSTHYFLVNNISRFNASNDVVPFAIVGLGGAYYTLKERSDRFFFAFDVGGGVDFEINEQFGLRLQGRLLMPMVLNGGGIYFGVDGGGLSSGISADATVPMIQSDFSLSFKYSL